MHDDSNAKMRPGPVKRAWSTPIVITGEPLQTEKFTRASEFTDHLGFMQQGPS